jgi:hypothetical protein
MENVFSEIMENKTDLELIEIAVFNKSQYLPEALNAAEYQIKKRNLNIDSIIKEIKETTNNYKEKEQRLYFNRRYILIGFVFFFR